MDKSFRVSLIASLLLHSLLFLLFPSPKKQIPQPPQPPRAVQVQLKGEQDPKKNDFIQMGNGEEACPRHYIGVGIKYAMMEITDISPGSPAEKIGLRVGDFILNMTAAPLTKVGQDFSITISRNSQVITFKATAKKICTK